MPSPDLHRNSPLSRSMSALKASASDSALQLQPPSSRPFTAYVAFLIAAHLFFCAAAMRFRALALIFRLGFVVSGAAACLILFHRSRCAFAILHQLPHFPVSVWALWSRLGGLLIQPFCA